jgi:hypothetical protein
VRLIPNGHDHGEEFRTGLRDTRLSEDRHISMDWEGSYSTIADQIHCTVSTLQLRLKRNSRETNTTTEISPYIETSSLP